MKRLGLRVGARVAVYGRVELVMSGGVVVRTPKRRYYLWAGDVNVLPSRKGVQP